MLRIVISCILISGTMALAQITPATEKHDNRDPIVTLDQLQKALDDIQQLSILTPEQKSFYASQVRSEYEINRKKADDAYAADLHSALDAWYANNKSWRKIPAEAWNKLTERDKGRIRDGIDPEVSVLPCSVVRGNP